MGKLFNAFRPNLESLLLHEPICHRLVNMLVAELPFLLCEHLELPFTKHFPLTLLGTNTLA